MIRKPPHLLITTPESLVPAADLRARPGDPRRLRAGDRRRDPRARRQQAAGPTSRSRSSASTLCADVACSASVYRRPSSRPPRPPASSSATIADSGGAPRPLHLVDAGRNQPLDIASRSRRRRSPRSPRAPRGPTSIQRSRTHLGQHKTTLIFVPSRRLAERVAHDLEQRLGEGVVAAHHGALSQAHAPERRGSGCRPARSGPSSRPPRSSSASTSATSSSSSRSARRARSRCCASGSAAPVTTSAGPRRAASIAMTRDDLIECAAAVRAMQAGRIDRPVQRDCPLDILAQQLVATCAAEDHGTSRPCGPWPAVPRRSPGSSAPPSSRSSTMLGDGTTTRRGRSGALLHLDRIEHRARGRRGARLAALTSGGAIPDKADYTVVEDSEPSRSSAPSTRTSRSTAWPATSSSSARTRGGSAGSSRAACASRTRAASRRTSRSGTARAWRARAELSAEVAGLRSELWTLLRASDRRGARHVLADRCGLGPDGVAQALAYIREGGEALGGVPTQDVPDRGALLRRVRRHAAGHPRPVRRAHQPGLRPRPAQEVLPHLRLRAAGRGHRRRDACCRSARSTRSRSPRSSSSCTSTRSTRR
jgi:ATP-dependent Lhr-like helicase